MLHGAGNHSTDFCRELKRLAESKKNGKNWKINAIEGSDSGDNEIKESEPYSHSFINAKFFSQKGIYNVNFPYKAVNPFKIIISTENKLTETLIDTGGDCSIININSIKNKNFIKKI